MDFAESLRLQDEWDGYRRRGEGAQLLEAMQFLESELKKRSSYNSTKRMNFQIKLKLVQSGKYLQEDIAGWMIVALDTW